MSGLDEFFEDSVIASALEDLEAGVEIDFNKIALKQTLQFARIGELFVADIIKQEKLADDQYEQLART